MMSLKITLLLAACLAVSYAKNVVTDCGGDDAWIKFRTLDITPEPFNILGKIKVMVDVETKKEIGGTVRMSVNLKKSNLNNGFTWEIPCTNIGLIGGAAQGIEGYLGTCDYRASCDFPFIKTWTTEGSCPSFFQEYNVPCSCPFPPTPFKTTEPVEVDLSQFEDKMPKWLIEGGYEVKAELKDSLNDNKIVGCLELKFDVSARKPCPEILKRLNACGTNQFY